MENKQTRGGKREGAGRPTLADNMRLLQMYIPQALLDQIDHQRGEASRADFIRSALTKHLSE